jgi:signal transduction histidine kinase
MRYTNLKEFSRDGYIGGLAGIGVSLTIALIIDGPVGNPVYWLFTVAFGFFIGFFISLGNELVLRQTMLILKHKSILICLFLSYILSTAIFLGITSLVKNLFYTIYSIPPNVNLLYMSLGAGIISTMIAFFFIYASEKEELLRLEKENRELAVVDERNRIARELHDSVSQNLFGISLHLNTLTLIMKKEPDKAQELAVVLREMVEEVQTEMRLMIYELRPTALAEKGFFEALESMVSLFRVRYGLDIHCDLNGDEILDSRKQLVLYRVLQEALNNIVKHAGATKVRVCLKVDGGTGELIVQDNGTGFEIQPINDASHDVGHFGIQGMKERIDAIQGQFSLESVLEKGTTVRAFV